MFFEKEISCHNSNTHNKMINDIFLIQKPVFTRFLKIIGVQDQLPITFCTTLSFHKLLKVKVSSSGVVSEFWSGGCKMAS